MTYVAEKERRLFESFLRLQNVKLYEKHAISPVAASSQSLMFTP